MAADFHPNDQHPLIPTRILVRVVAALVGLGTTAILMARYLPWHTPSEWSSVGPSLLVNLGVALGYSTVLVLLVDPIQRKFRGVVRAEVKDQTKAAVRPLENQVGELGRNVASLGDRIDELLRSRNDKIDRAVAAVQESPSFESVVEALTLANDLNALGTGIATVQGGDDDVPDEPLSLRVRFLWGGVPGAEPSLHVQAVCEGSLYAFLNQDELGTQNFATNHNDHLIYDHDWEPEQSAEAVFLILRRQVERKNMYFSEKALNWPDTFSELHRSLQLAISSTRGDQGTWRLVGRLLERVGDWAITTHGVEHPAYAGGIVFSPSDYPPFYPADGQPEFAEFVSNDLGELENGFPTPPGQSPQFFPTLKSPPGLPPADGRLYERAGAHLPLRKSPNTPSGWMPAIASDVRSS